MGYASPRRMVREAGLWEFGIWAALYSQNPWGEMRADQRAAIGHALLANINRDSRRRPEPFPVRDFMPYLQLTPEERERELAERIVAAFSALGRDAPADGRKAWDKSKGKRPRK